MKTKIISALLAATLLTTMVGCSESNQTVGSESRHVRQLKLEKTQLVQEFQKTQADLNNTIAKLKSEIAEKDTVIQQNANKDDGMAAVVSEIMQQMKNLEDKVDALKIENDALKSKVTEPKEPAIATPSEKPKKKDVSSQLEMLKKLQKKSAETQK